MVRSITEDRKTIKKEKRVLFEEKLAIFFGEYMKKKKVQKKRKRNKHSKFFKMLMKSVNEAVAIHKGEIEPARITTLKM
ncbi:hypothetical protein LAN17_20265 [Mycobacterium tuberculosis]|nr:hypothetical protein [Mycobacterium tuberculosis]